TASARSPRWCAIRARSSRRSGTSRAAEDPGRSRRCCTTRFATSRKRPAGELPDHRRRRNIRAVASNRTLERKSIPSVDGLLRRSDRLVAAFGRPAVTAAIRAVLGELRAGSTGEPSSGAGETAIIDRVAQRLISEAQPSLRRVLNLTGTVLHTNLGRAGLPAEAIDAVAAAAGGASNLEYDLAAGRRGD